MSVSLQFPGVESPSADFDEPFAMLQACHQRTQRTLRLLGKLSKHLKKHVIDQQARDAAEDVLRFFRLAAPLHHEDEDRHVFPAARELGDGSLLALVTHLEQEHLDLHAQWQSIEAVLASLAGTTTVAFDVEGFDRLVRDFAKTYEAHIAREETVLFPFVSAHTTAASLTRISEDMRARRMRSANTAARD